MALPTRKAVREALGSTLTTDLTGVGNPVQTLYDYPKADFEGESPVITLGSASTAPSEMEHFGGWGAVYSYFVYSFVAREEGGEEEAEDELDNVAESLRESLESVKGNTSDWGGLEFSNESVIVAVSIGGEPYWMETTMVMIGVYE